MNKKKTVWWVMSFIVSAAVITVAASRTSPFYSLLLGDYSDNPASAAMLIGKYWLQGEVPYKDLFTVGGPLYFLIQAAGWGIGGRNGIFVLEIVSYMFFLIYMQKVLGVFVRERTAAALAVVSVVPYVALCSGGNSGGEWCLPWIAIVLYLTMKDMNSKYMIGRKMVLTGVVCGLIILTQPVCGGVVYGAILYMALTGWKEESASVCGKRCLLVLAGIAIPVLMIFAYFAFSGGFQDMFQGAFLYPIKMLPEGFESLKLVVHKFVKCIVVLPMLGAGIYHIHCGKREMGGCLVSIAVVSVLMLLFADNSWCHYLSVIPCMLLAIAALFSAKEKRVSGIAVTMAGIVITGILFIPFKNYGRYLMEGVPEVVEEFYGDIKNYREELGTCRIMMVDMDSSYYLMLDEKPLCRYFSGQTELEKYIPEAKEERESYLDGTKDVDVYLTTERGWVGQDLERYTLVQVYVKKGGNLCVYLVNN